MKTLREFLSEDAASDTQSTINRDVKGKGGDIAYRSKRGDQFSVLDLLKRKKKDNGGGQDQETSQEKPDGPGKQPDRKPQPYRSSRIRPRKPQSYRSSKPQSSKPQRSLPKERNVQHFLQVRTRWLQKEQLLQNNHHNINRSLQDQHQLPWLVVDRDLQSDLPSLICQETTWVYKRSTYKTSDQPLRRG